MRPGPYQARLIPQASNLPQGCQELLHVPYPFCVRLLCLFTLYSKLPCATSHFTPTAALAHAETSQPYGRLRGRAARRPWIPHGPPCAHMAPTVPMPPSPALSCHPRIPIFLWAGPEPRSESFPVWSLVPRFISFSHA